MSRALYRGLSRRLADAWAACGYQEMKASVADPFSETCVSNCIHSAAGHTHYTQHYTLCACVLGGKGGDGVGKPNTKASCVITLSLITEQATYSLGHPLPCRTAI